MVGQIQVPKLPGYIVNAPASLGNHAFNKKQTLKYVKGYAVEDAVLPLMVGDLPEDSGTTQMELVQTSPKSTDLLGTSLPKWVEYDRKVLRWYGYFKEAVTESPTENYRVRRVVVLYYLEDDSIEVAEPKQENSGIPQGAFIKRHRIRKEDGTFFQIEDFTVGDTVTMYGRVFYVTDCDAFTRNYLTEKGREPAPSIPLPESPYDTRRMETLKRNASAHKDEDSPSRFFEATLGKTMGSEKLKQFMRNSRKVLRFYCIWDDRQSMYGDRRPYRLHFFLEDNTVEVLESHENNSGRDPFPVFLKRGELCKFPTSTSTTKGRKLTKDMMYGPADFHIGSYLRVHGRDFFIHDCDDFTRNWYKENLGCNDEEMACIDVKEPVPRPARPALPPYNGFGSLEDSAQSCTNLVPKPPKKDFYKLMNKDKIILRFGCCFGETDTHKLSAADGERKFVLSYFMADDTISVFEPPCRNSGIIGGKYLERSKVYKPNGIDSYDEKDLYVGAVLPIHHRTFELLEADEFTLQYMENNRHIYSMADHEAAARTIAAQVAGREDEVRAAFVRGDPEGHGSLTAGELEAALRAAGVATTRHQAIALHRRLDRDKAGSIATHELLAHLFPPPGSTSA